MVGFAVTGKLAAVALSCFGLVAAASNNQPGPKHPMQLRLAYAGNTGMTVSWNTFHKLDKPKVHYGTSRKDLSKTATSSVSVTYNTSTTFNNHVKITGLKPDTLYYYRPSYGRHVDSFKTSRPVDSHKPFTVATVVDLGTMGELGLGRHTPDNPLVPGELNTIQSLNMHKDEFDFLFHPGDIGYADYWLKEEIQGYLPKTKISQGYKVYEKILNKFYDEMERITSTKPYMVGPGNHEANCDNGGTTNDATNKTYTVDICLEGQTNFTGYRHHFRMPSAESGGQGNFWYSFDHGMTHFVIVNTETDFGPGIIAPDEPGYDGTIGEDSGPFGSTKNAQIKFLEADLAAVDRKKTPWVVVGGHRPWYISAEDPSDICTACQNVFEPIFKKHGVDLVMSGHYHSYQRNAPLYKGKVDPNGLHNPTFPWYITNGAGGHYDGLDTLAKPLDSYARFAQDTTYGWSRLKFHNCTHLTHEFVKSGNGKVLDSATLFKDRKCKN